MNSKKTVLFISTFLILSITIFAEFPKLTGPYFGQKPPGDTAEVFAPGLISTGLFSRDVAISPDGKEIYFGVIVGYFTSAILYTKEVNGTWTKPEVAPFSTDSNHNYAEPFITADGKKFFFTTKRSGNYDIWAMDRKGDGWGEPYNMGAPINTELGEYFPSVTKDGTMYFTRDTLNPRGSFIFRSRLKDGKYTEPEKLGPKINPTPGQANAFIAPDESYLIIPMEGKDSIGGIDYYILFRSKDDKWSAPINMGKAINTRRNEEWSPYVSPDGKYFFFMSKKTKKPAEFADKPLTFDLLKKMHMRPQTGNPCIYWIKADFIEKLRPK